MAQTMLLTANAKVDLRSKGSLVGKLKPKPLSSLFLPSLPLRFSSSTTNASFSKFTTSTVAMFKSKAKAPPKKVALPKEKEKVEDGIFGTSGGIGFTKQNELFVGRVAMIGFAASLLGEAVTGKGILAQLNLETGIPIYEAEPLLLFFILFNLLGAIGALGDRGKFIDDPAPPTGLEKAVIPPGRSFKSALGLSEGGPLFGFTKANELFVGRLAQLGIAFSIIGEIVMAHVSSGATSRGDQVRKGPCGLIRHLQLRFQVLVRADGARLDSLQYQETLGEHDNFWMDFGSLLTLFWGRLLYIGFVLVYI